MLRRAEQETENGIEDPVDQAAGVNRAGEHDEETEQFVKGVGAGRAEMPFRPADPADLATSLAAASTSSFGMPRKTCTSMKTMKGVA